jgi:hypothetical protein
LMYDEFKLHLGGPAIRDRCLVDRQGHSPQCIITVSKSGHSALIACPIEPPSPVDQAGF